LRDEQAVLALRAPELDSLQYVFDAVTQIRKELDGRVPLIGFSGSPWTLACYMVEGGGSDDFRRVKTMLYDRPDLMHHILETNAAAVAAYLNAQIDAGAQAVMIFDTWGGALADGVYQEFSLSYMAKVMQQLQREKDGVQIPAIVFTKGGGLWLEQIADIGADAVGLDWTVNLGGSASPRGTQSGAAGQSGPERLVRRPGSDPRRSAQGIGSILEYRQPVTDTYSIWVMAFLSSRRRRPSRCWWKPCMR